MTDDGLRTALVAIKAKLQQRSDEGEAHLFLNLPYWELEELLAEYPADSPHLTDDGAADTPPADKGVGSAPAAESATPALTGAVAPSSPHPTTPTSARRRIANALAGSDVIEPGYEYLVHAQAFTVADVLLAAGLFGEGATPAIDREALLQVVAEQIDDLDRVPPMGSPAEHLERRAVHVTDAVLKLIAGAS